MKTSLFIVASSLLILSLPACSLSESDEEAPPPGEVLPTHPATPQGECVNPLFPVVPLAHWDYQAENLILGNYTFSYQVGTVGSDRFNLDIEFSTGISYQMEWSCDEGNLLQMDASNGPAGVFFSFGGSYGSMETEDVYGVTLPASVSEGDTWLHGLNLSGELRLPNGNIGSAKGSYSASYSALGYEQVDVPAGTFQAMLIKVSMLYDLVAHINDLDIAAPVSADIYLWYAPGVGLVKAEKTTDVTGFEIIELWWYDIP